MNELLSIYVNYGEKTKRKTKTLKRQTNKMLCRVITCVLGGHSLSSSQALLVQQ